MNDVSATVLRAEEAVRAYVRETPLEYSLPLSALLHCHVYLKLENMQHTGSFKVRGAMNHLLSLPAEQRARGVVAASSGNHGIAVAFGLHRLGLQGIVFVPEGASSTKMEAIRAYGVEVRVYGQDCVVTEEYARAYARQRQMAYVSPYNDAAVIAGQGTIGVELHRQREQIDAVFVALGGGGLISGIAGYLKAVRPALCVVGCSPHRSAVMFESLRAGQIVQMEAAPTLSDGTAGGIEPGALTFPLCQQLIDTHVLVSEEEIRRAMLLIMQLHHQLIEGAAGVPVAALVQQQERFRGQHVVLVLCGANVSLDVLRLVLDQHSDL
ncbi:MAG TPA: threonine/serine dehydratase [Ktedonobacteraceae bacterium]|jgi:threonine dehydratase